MNRAWLMTLALMTASACVGSMSNKARSGADGGTPSCAVNANDEIRLRLEPSCVSCHGAGSSRPFFATLSAFETLLAYAPSMVKPGNPDGSPLILMLEGRGTGAYRQMPLNGEPFADLNPQLAADVRAWVQSLNASSRPVRANRGAAVTRRLSADEIINAMSVALGFEPTSGVPPLLPTSGTSPLSPDSPRTINYLDGSRRDVYSVLGGPSYLEQRRAETEWSPTSLIALSQVAQGACAQALQSNKLIILRFVTLEDRLPAAEAKVKENIAYLYERFLQSPPTAEDVSAFYERVYVPAEPVSTRVAWVQVCAALFRDPLFVSF